MLKDIIIDHCYPTLSNLKFANMVSVDYYDSIYKDILDLNEDLNRSNFRLIILKQNSKKLLLYLVNLNLMDTYDNEKSKSILKSYGYPIDNFNNSLTFLKKRLSTNDFPHEIGFFLGYPYDDVIGFINCNGKDEMYTGKWKVYSNLEEAKKTFAKYEIAKCIAKELSLQGKSLFDIINYFKE